MSTAFSVSATAYPLVLAVRRGPEDMGDCFLSGARATLCELLTTRIYIPYFVTAVDVSLGNGPCWDVYAAPAADYLRSGYLATAIAVLSFGPRDLYRSTYVVDGAAYTYEDAPLTKDLFMVSVAQWMTTLLPRERDGLPASAKLNPDEYSERYKIARSNLRYALKEERKCIGGKH